VGAVKRVEIRSSPERKRKRKEGCKKERKKKRRK
jgi:hypothetical protein